MTGEINLPTLSPAPTAGPAPAPAPATGELLKLLEPQIGLIDRENRERRSHRT